MPTDFAVRLEAVSAERPDLDLVGRQGQRVPLNQAHADQLFEITQSDPTLDYAPGALAHVDADGVLTTVNQGAGSWNITAHTGSSASWLTVSEVSGEELAQRDTDLGSIDEVMLSIFALWNWATVGPKVY